MMATPEMTPRVREFEFSLPVGVVDENGVRTRRIVLRKMTGREEAILADKKNQRNGGKLVTELIASCVVAVGDQPRNGATSRLVGQMYSVDRNFLLLKLRSITFGPELQTSYNCPHCNEVMRMTEDLDELPVKVLDNPESAEDISLQLTDGYIDRDGQTYTSVTLRLPTGADEEAVAPMMRQNPAEGKNALLARCLRSFGDMPKHRVEAIGSRIIAELTLADRRIIDRALNQAAPGVSLIRHIDCPFCGQSFNASLDLSRFLALE
jgi:hypothetical protein